MGMCNVFSTYYLDVETPWMIVAPLEEIEPTVHPCAPEYPENPDFWAQWRQQLYGISLELSQELPENGMFISNCPHHVSMLDPTIWGELEVPALDNLYVIWTVKLSSKLGSINFNKFTDA